MRVTIISGFLGAGKTTMVKHILSQSGPETAVLVNDFGETGIDGEVLSGENLDIMEMPSGCICCTLKNELIIGLNDLYASAKPEKLVIEPSGLADLTALLEALEMPQINAPLEIEAIITVVEPEMFLTDLEQDAFGDFYHDQIGKADIVLLNKCDLSTTEEIERATEELKKINSEGAVLTAVHCQVTIPKVDAKGRKSFKKHEHDHDHDEAEAHGHSKLSSLAFRKKGVFTNEKIEDLLHQVVEGDFGSIYRAKGFFKGEGANYHFDLVRSRWSITEWEKPVDESRFVFIGDNLGNIEEAIDQLPK